jgi:1-hydroxy-2-naphthoate dioxygenase
MELQDLEKWLAERNLTGNWAREERPGLRIETKPFLWRWSDIYEGLRMAFEIAPMDDAVRRTIGLRIPGVQGGITPTLSVGCQLIRPGETARTHRHVMTATRFIIKGSPKAVTVVEGERFPMEEGDLVTTPNWTWHDHFNGSSEPVIWLDGIDPHLVHYLGVSFFELFNRERQSVEKPDGYSMKTLGHARPSWMKPDHLVPPFRYPWNEIYPNLLALKESEGDPFDGVRLEYVNPLNGGPTFPTFTCEMQLLRPREKTRSHRHTGFTIYHAFRGQGVTTVEKRAFCWNQGDIFMVPTWQWHRHENTSDQDAILYSIADRPALKLLGVYREEAES